MLQFDVLVERSLRSVGFLASLVVAYIVSGNLTCCPSQSFLLFLCTLMILLRVSMILTKRVVVVRFQATYN
jgi:hypothetical protein